MNATMETVTIADSRLAAAVKAVGGIIPKRSQKPILTNAKLVATAGGFHVYATDLETQVSVTVGDAEGSPTGETLIPANVVAAIGKAVKSAPSLTIGQGTVETLGMTSPTDDMLEYPIGETPIDDGFAAMIPFGFIRLVDDHVSCATDDESSRYALGGVLFERLGVDETLRAVGTDGRRLHVMAVASGGSVDYPRDQRPETNAIVYPHAIRQFRKAVETVAAALAGKAGKAAQTYADGGRVGIKVVNSGGTDSRNVPLTTTIEFSWCAPSVTVRVSTRCVQGRFPRWRDCFPAESFETLPCYLPMPATVDQVKAAARVTSEQSKGVHLDGGRLTARSAEHGTYDAAFVGDVPDGTKIKLDPRFWADAAEGAAAIHGDKRPVRMHVRDHESGATFEGGVGLNPTGDAIGFAAVVMPLAAD
jgi:hypothetical protein